jgi:hypothetical protein
LVLDVAALRASAIFPARVLEQSDPAEAFDYLSRYGHRALVEMPTTTFWHGLRSELTNDEQACERTFDLRRLASEILRVDEHDRVLMAPKITAKGAAGLGGRRPTLPSKLGVSPPRSAGSRLPCQPAVKALCEIEVLLASGRADGSKQIHHQLKVFQAWEHGLLATWEAPAELICVRRVESMR